MIPTAGSKQLDYAVPDSVRPISVGNLLARPIGWPFLIAIAVVAAVTLYADSGPVPYNRPSLIAFAGWVVILIVYARQFVAAVRSNGLKLLQWKPYAVVPVVGASIIVLIAADVPRRTAFAVARPALDRLAVQQLSQPDGSARQTDIGIYGRCTVVREGPNVLVLVHGTEFWDINGFAYCPSGPPPGPGAYLHFDGAWCRYFRSL